MKHFKKHMLALLVIAGVLVACTEEIDKSNRYTFTEYTVLSYLQENPQFSEYVTLLGQVPISEVSSSTVAQLLSARGAFTCFAPNNEAIQLYLDSLRKPAGTVSRTRAIWTPSARSSSTTASSTAVMPRALRPSTPVTSLWKTTVSSRLPT